MYWRWYQGRSLAFSTIVSLLFLPTIYAMLDDLRLATSRVIARARGVDPVVAEAALRPTL